MKSETASTKSTMIVSIILALVFLASGFTKLAGMEMHVQGFDRWGYPIWFMYVTGLLEVLGAGLLIVPAVRFFGGLLLGCVMVGAIGTHLMHGEITMAGAPTLLGILLAWVIWKTRGPYVEPSSEQILHGDELERAGKRFAP